MKLFQTIPAFLLTIACSSLAFAISNADLVEACLETGKKKVESQAQAYGCRVNINNIDVNNIDNRWYNPSKYVWYEVEGRCGQYDRVIQLVQYYRGKCI